MAPEGDRFGTVFCVGLRKLLKGIVVSRWYNICFYADDTYTTPARNKAPPNNNLDS
jgi:hypothetical protein